MTGPWKAFWKGQFVGAFTTRRAAQASLGQFPYRRGPARVRHQVTGEEWRRDGRAWVRNPYAGAASSNEAAGQQKGAA